MQQYDLENGRLSPHLVYASYDEFGSKINDMFTARFGNGRSFDIFEYPEIVYSPGLPKLSRLPALVYHDRNVKGFNNPDRWVVMDIPSQVYNELSR